MSLAPLAPNRIHSLPVQVNYHLPSSSHTFTTIFTSLQQVYVHPNAAPSKNLGEDEAWGSIYLKTVVQGVLRASPELHPAHPNTPDLSLYILDAQETYLRRSRASSPFPPHLRSAHASSPRVDADGSFPALGGASHQAQSMQEVWTGKGLVTWALDEPGDGKNLITGRLMKTRDFGHVVKGQDLSPLEEMMMADQEGDEESWGIEISLGLRSGSGGPVGAQLQVQQVKAVNAGKSDTFSRCSLASDTSISPAEGSGSQLPLQPDAPSRLEAQQPTLHAPVKVQTSHPLSPKRTVSTTPHVRAHEISKRHSSGKRKKTHHADPTRQSMVQSHSHPVDRKSTSKLRPMRTSSSQHMGGSDIRRQQLHNDSFPNDLPGQLYVKPDTLTPEQAQRLIESPAFLSMLEKLTGQPILAARGNKRALEQEGEESDPANKASDPAKKAKHEPPFKVPGIPSGSRAPPADPQTVLKCWNCGRTKSAVWRMKVMEDGKSVRVCNACGLYWNKLRQMRPPTLWEGVEDDPRSLAKRDKTTGMTPAPTPSSHNDRPASRIDSGGGFKRTLSAVVEQDAQRIASLRYRPSAPKSSLNQSHKAIPMTSPPRASTSASRSMRNVRWNGNAHAGASSPGGWAEPMHPGVPQSDNFNPVNESPNTAIRRILGTEIPMQSLEMPLSDDGTMSRPTDAATFNWDTDLSAFFDVEGFSLDSDPAQGRSPPAEPTKFHRALSSAARRRREETATEDEDALSQLLNRASSIGLESSPIPFDFSQLPPSSPPVMPNDLPHSALLLSSPDNSPMGYSPLDRELIYRISPEKRSGLHQSFMPNDEKSNLDYADPHHQGNYDAFHELLGRMQDADGSMMSSAGMAEGLVGGDDLLALLNSSFNAE